MRFSFAKEKKWEKSKKKRSGKRIKTAPLVKFEFRVHGACKTLIFISSDFEYSKKKLYLLFFSRTEESSWIIKVCVNYFKTVFIDAYAPNVETTKPNNITWSHSRIKHNFVQKDKNSACKKPHLLKIYITVIVTIWSISCSREFSDVVARNFITKLVTDKLIRYFRNTEMKVSKIGTCGPISMNY